MINKIPMIQYQQWYRKHGIRMLSQLTAPPTTPYMELALPKNSVFHWFGYGYNDQVGLNQDDQIAKNVERLIYASNIENYQQQDVVGNPRNLPIITTSMTREYFHQNKKIRMLKGNINEINDDKCLIVFNYGLLNDHYRYTGSITNELDRWLNYNRTIYNNIARVAKTSNRQHFVEIEVPTVIPPLTYLLAAEDGLSKDNIRKLTTASDWQVSEFFNLIATSYKAYVFKDIFNDKETLNKINIILTANGYFAVINLGLLHSFTEDSSGDSKSQLKLKIAKRFLSSLINLRGGNTDLTTSIANSDARDRLINDFNTIKEDEEEQINKVQSVIQVKEDNDVSSSRVSDDPFSQFKEPVAAPVVDTTINDDKEINDENDDIDSLVDKQLQALENVEVLDDDQNTAYKAYTAPILTPQEKIKEKAIEFQKAGILTPGEVAGISKRAEKINTLADPRGSSKPFVESVKISKEELSIDDKVAIAPASIKGVTDKSMLYSSINKMDEQYINHTLNKDIGQMVLSLQKAGIVVLDYNIERKKDITSDFEIHKIKVQPVGGGESTISFKIPKVNSDGTFTINNVKSRMRKQRVDIPIRKVGPDEVALTSYYSKLFVTRTPRKRFNYSFWITNEIVACGIDTNATNIVNVKLNNSFSQAHLTPRAYSAISMRIASFESNGYTFYFDVTKLKENFGIEYDKKAKFIAVAKNNKGNILYLDFYNQLFDGKNIIGRIEEFIGLDVTKIPKEFAEFSLFGKEIPIVFILAYQLGLGNLLKTLNVNYKLVGKREQIDLEDMYDSLTFNDVKFVYETSNPQANLIINGLRRLASPNIKFNFYDFDKKHVYNDVLDKLGVPLRYLKEIPLMFDLWVDHITKEILEEMKEPTDLVLLLLRAVELLTNDEFPEVNDTTYMRDRGYERVSGIIFSEMVTAMRKYRAKPVNKKNVFELHPDAVWYSILQDQSVIITEESNPVHACKEQEIVVYRGAGGRSSLTMTAKDRKFHKNSIGVTSEATVDNSETGTVVYTSYNPNYTSVRGLSKPVDISKGVENPAQILSTTAMLNPSVENEDRKIA